MPKNASPTRTYVAMCNKPNFDGYCFKKFTLPEKSENNVDYAAWYFLNHLDFTACIEECITIEDYLNVREVVETKDGNFTIKSINFKWVPGSPNVRIEAEVTVGMEDKVVTGMISRKKMEMIMISTPASSIALEMIMAKLK